MTKSAPQQKPRLSDHAIAREVDGSRGRYVVTKDGLEAELTYSIASPTLIVADHTGVPDEWRGDGVGYAIFQRGVEDARAEGVKIMPLCPYVNKQRARHPEWADVFAV